VGPPQSTPVSPAFFTPSLHAAATHTPAVQTALSQSAPEMHLRPVPHLLHTPPQSVSVSLQFCTLSLHAGGGLEPFLPPDPHCGALQAMRPPSLAHALPGWQSALLVQEAPGLHLPQMLVPPQSTSLSFASFAPFEHTPAAQ
jgi:hypothetical protein